MANQSGEKRSESLVCKACLSGPFAFDSFQEAITRVPSGGFTYSSRWKEIQNAAKGGCNWCELLAFAHRTRPDLASNGLQDGDLVNVRFRVEASKKSKSTLCFFINSVSLGTFTIYADHGDEAANYISTGDIPRPFVDYDVATEWINKCAGHDCCETKKKVVLPTRVIDCSEPEKPKLLITKGLPKELYTALSYVWGSREIQSHITTTENLDEYVQGIDVNALPQTIVDAIMSTHKLGFKYLWVDSLCILQAPRKSEAVIKDKEKEMAKMQWIYRNAVVTIVARSAYAVNEGFLQDVQPAVRLPFQCRDGKVGSMLAQRRCTSSDRNMGEGKDGISTRAWCCQEATLPPRLLIFSSPHLFFRCRSIAAEITSGLRVQTTPQPSESHLLFPNKPDIPLSSADFSDLDDLWTGILHDYSGRQMGYPSDKLDAIAGVVESFHQVWGGENIAGLGGEYIAGLWRRTLIEDLMWRSFTTSSSPLSPRPHKKDKVEEKVYRAPSWSWAATDGAVLPHRDHHTLKPYEYECKIEECKVTPLSDEVRFGQVTDGFLKLKAKMKNVTWDPRNCRLIESLSLSDETVGTSADPEPTSTVQVYPDSVEDVTKGIGEVLLVLMRLGKTPRIWANGLLVVPHEEKKGCYRRVGVLFCRCVPHWYETAECRTITIF